MVDGFLKCPSSFRVRFPVIAALALMSLVAGCAQTSAPLLHPAAYERSPQPTNQLGVGDKVRIKVFGEEELSGSYSITADGQIEGGFKRSSQRGLFSLIAVARQASLLAFSSRASFSVVH